MRRCPVVSRVLGSPVDDQTRCKHYRTPLDVVAIKFWCCQEYYPCHLCHQESADHPAAQWPVDEQASKAILCGVCTSELSVCEYLEVGSCPHCAAPFNPRCHLHADLYFVAPHEG
ncbi:hypothetical protein I2485_00645 [Nesterenkonia sp. E16_7]|uniref:CHY zinc finger protein n=1 Tax=unclassified Nesterenkonia TaxID=2629769 RepID=UPI001A90DFF8|nr:MULTISPECIES: CHY zinc finger protein [unclassified Nesterenkonia]MBO0596250.1 hypothetical protein [Nesterenkonia sp. E16_10]MBO0597155.1 hypothetical protein [Nesterenkonia sp. E16_7]